MKSTTGWRNEEIKSNQIKSTHLTKKGRSNDVILLGQRNAQQGARECICTISPIFIDAATWKFEVESGSNHKSTHGMCIWLCMCTLCMWL
jgi:hypothetical protein